MHWYSLSKYQFPAELKVGFCLHNFFANSNYLVHTLIKTLKYVLTFNLNVFIVFMPLNRWHIHSRHKQKTKRFLHLQNNWRSASDFLYSLPEAPWPSWSTFSSLFGMLELAPSDIGCHEPLRAVVRHQHSIVLAVSLTMTPVKYVGSWGP